MPTSRRSCSAASTSGPGAVDLTFGKTGSDKKPVDELRLNTKTQPTGTSSADRRPPWSDLQLPDPDHRPARPDAARARHPAVQPGPVRRLPERPPPRRRRDRHPGRGHRRAADQRPDPGRHPAPLRPARDGPRHRLLERGPPAAPLRAPTACSTTTSRLRTRSRTRPCRTPATPDPPNIPAGRQRCRPAGSDFFPARTGARRSHEPSRHPHRRRRRRSRLPRRRRPVRGPRRRQRPGRGAGRRHRRCGPTSTR